MVYSTSGKPVVYRPEQPEVLMDRLKYDYQSIADSLKLSLKKIQPEPAADSYWNLTGRNQFISKASEIIRGAVQEILISSNILPDTLYDPLKEALAAKVRVVLFSFEIQNSSLPGLELFYNPKFNGAVSTRKRFLMTADFKAGLIAGGSEDGDYSGVFSSDPLLVSVITEHIHHNIYSFEFEKKYSRDIFEESMRIHTLQENYFQSLK
jgi:sugar-specific transcriptional regulator TrmB